MTCNKEGHNHMAFLTRCTPSIGLVSFLDLEMIYQRATAVHGQLAMVTTAGLPITL